MRGQHARARTRCARRSLARASGYIPVYPLAAGFRNQKRAVSYVAHLQILTADRTHYHTM